MAGWLLNQSNKFMEPILLPTAPIGYRTQSTDCSIASDLLHFELLRRWSPTQRLLQSGSLMRSARQLSLNAHRQRFPQLTTAALGQKLAQAWLQEYYPAAYIPAGTEMTWIQDSIQLAGQLHELFVENDISYYVTGGVAAVAYGETRTTQDLNVVLAVDVTDLSRIATIFEAAGFYVSGLDDVVTKRMSSFQVTQIETISRADLMIPVATEFSRIQLTRRKTIPIAPGKDVYFASPEDVIINKLLWGKQSASEKQWRDVLSIMKTQREALEYDYLGEWADKLGITPDYLQATIEAGVSEFAQ
jgi:hypothetical protein